MTLDPNLPLDQTLRVGMDIAGYESFQVNEETGANQVWDPQTTWAQESWELFRCCLLRTLMSYNGRPTEEGGSELRPDLAADEPTISADGLTWTFRLKEGLHYAPPFQTTPIVAADIVRALERALRPDPLAAIDDYVPPFTPYAYIFQDVIAGAEEFSKGTVNTISGLEADGLTLVVHLLRPAGDLSVRLEMPAAAPIPEGAAAGHDSGYGRYVVASGPYMIEGSDLLEPSRPPGEQPMVSGYAPGSHLYLVRNPSWDRASDPLRPALANRIEISQVDDYAAGMQAVRDGTLDVLLDSDVDPDDARAIISDAALAARLHFTAALRMNWISMNLAVAPFDDVHVRRAVQFATNKRALASILYGLAAIQSHAVPDAFEGGLLSDYDPYATANQGGSLELAKSEMALSRYDSNADGVCDAAACQDVYLPVRNDRPEVAVAAASFVGSLAALGMTIRVEAIDRGEEFGYVTDPSSHAAMAFPFGWGSDYLGGSAWFVPLASSATIGRAGGANMSLIGATSEQLQSFGYDAIEVPSLDSKINSCIAETGSAQFACWAETDQYLMERVASWVPLANEQFSRLTSSWVTAFNFDAPLTMPALDQIRLERSP